MKSAFNNPPPPQNPWATPPEEQDPQWGKSPTQNPWEQPGQDLADSLPRGPLGQRGGHDTSGGDRGAYAVGQGQWAPPDAGGRPAPSPVADPGGFYQDPSTANQPPKPEAPLAGPGYNEDLYKNHGQDLLGTPSASEDLYAKGVAASNPFYDYAQQQTTRAINDAAAARGNSNSSYTMKTIGNAVADLRGQQAHELAQLAGQADQGKFGRYDRSFDYARGAQNSMEGRARQGMDYESEIAARRANLVNPFYAEGGKEMNAAQMAYIEVMLKQSGMDVALVNQIIGLLGGAGKAGVTALTA